MRRFSIAYSQSAWAVHCSLAAKATPDPMAVTGGISQALITTASGLVIALCVLFPYGFFRTRVRARLSEYEAAARRLGADS